MTDNFITQRWAIPGGAVTLRIDRDAPLIATAYEQIGTVIAAGDELVKWLRENEPPQPLADWEKELLAATEPRPDDK